MAAFVFLSYRRDDNRQAAGRLADGLEAALGAGSIFLDDRSIAHGADYVSVIREQILAVESMVVLIGANWRIDQLAQPDDDVRIEIEAALEHGKYVLPVLLDGIDMPAPDALPPSLRQLSFRNAARLRAGDFRHDMEEIVADLKRAAPASLSIRWRKVWLMFGTVTITLDNEVVATGKMGKDHFRPAQRIGLGRHHLSVQTTAAGGIGRSDTTLDIAEGGAYTVEVEYNRTKAIAECSVTKQPR